MLICLRIIYACFHTTVAELACKTLSIYCVALYRKNLPTPGLNNKKNRLTYKARISKMGNSRIGWFGRSMMSSRIWFFPNIHYAILTVSALSPDQLPS